MKERPILFSAPMVRAILEGRKTQTRRVVKLNASGRVKEAGSSRNWHLGDPNAVLACPYGQPGDRLWVRETWAKANQRHGSSDKPYAYRADLNTDEFYAGISKWRPGIHMPRIASRILLEVVSVRVERLQGISEADCIAEGCTGGHGPIAGYNYSATSREHYRWLWESINGPESWDANPLVWVVEFRKVQP